MATRRESVKGVKAGSSCVTTLQTHPTRLHYPLKGIAIEPVARAPPVAVGPLTRARRSSLLFGIRPCVVKLTPLPEVEAKDGGECSDKKTTNRRACVVTPPTGKSRASKRYAKTPVANRTRRSGGSARTGQQLEGVGKPIRKRTGKKVPQAFATEQISLIGEDPAPSILIPPGVLSTSGAEVQSQRAALTPTTPERSGYMDDARASLPRSPHVFIRGWSETDTPIEHLEKLDVNPEAQKPVFSPCKSKFDSMESSMPRNSKRMRNQCDLMNGEGEGVSPKTRLGDTFLSDDSQLVTGHLGKMCIIM